MASQSTWFVALQVEHCTGRIFRPRPSPLSGPDKGKRNIRDDDDTRRLTAGGAVHCLTPSPITSNSSARSGSEPRFYPAMSDSEPQNASFRILARHSGSGFHDALIARPRPDAGPKAKLRPGPNPPENHRARPTYWPGRTRSFR